LVLPINKDNISFSYKEGCKGQWQWRLVENILGWAVEMVIKQY